MFCEQLMPNDTVMLMLMPHIPQHSSFNSGQQSR